MSAWDIPSTEGIAAILAVAFGAAAAAMKVRAKGSTDAAKRAEEELKTDLYASLYREIGSLRLQLKEAQEQHGTDVNKHSDDGKTIVALRHALTNCLSEIRWLRRMLLTRDPTIELPSEYDQFDQLLK